MGSRLAETNLKDGKNDAGTGVAVGWKPKVPGVVGQRVDGSKESAIESCSHTALDLVSRISMLTRSCKSLKGGLAIHGGAKEAHGSQKIEPDVARASGVWFLCRHDGRVCCGAVVDIRPLHSHGLRRSRWLLGVGHVSEQWC